MRSTDSISNAIYRSLQKAPLLTGNLPGALCFDRSAFLSSSPAETLNLEQKLGHLYEDALGNLISASTDLELIARNLQIFEDSGKTLGELDFVVYDSRVRKHLHIELAVKFYLGVQDGRTWQFPGPDPRDNWDQKLQRMRSHQFQLVATPEARSMLYEKFGIREIGTQHLIYGRLFDPLGSPKRPKLAAMALNANRGRWLYVHDWAKHFLSDSEVRLILKPLWPVEMNAEIWKILTPIATEDLLKAAESRCVMFTTHPSEDPCFLVPSSWPNFAQKSKILGDF